MVTGFPAFWLAQQIRIHNPAETIQLFREKVVGKNVHPTIPKGNMGYDQYTISDTVAVEPTFVAFF